MTGPHYVPPRLVSIPDAARELGVSRSALWEQVWAGKIHSVEMGRRRFIPRATIERLCADNEEPTGGLHRGWQIVPPTPKAKAQPTPARANRASRASR